MLAGYRRRGRLARRANRIRWRTVIRMTMLGTSAGGLTGFGETAIQELVGRAGSILSPT